jgi:hypothetical protein
MTLADEHVAAILATSTVRSVDSRIPQVSLDGLPGDLVGIWSLWLIVAHAGPTEEVRALPIFHDASGIERAPSARVIWDRLLEADVQIEIRGELESAASSEAATRSRQEAERQGRSTYDTVRLSLESRLRRRRDRFLEYIERRRRIVERVGLENVRRRRLAELDREKEREIAAMPLIEVAPELRCVAIVELVR